MKATFITLLSVILALCVFVSCGERLDSGYVIRKVYTPAHIIYQPVFNGKTTMLIPLSQPETCEIVFGKDGRKRCVGVKKDTFDKAEIGDSVYVHNNEIKIFRRICNEETF